MGAVGSRRGRGWQGVLKVSDTGGHGNSTCRIVHMQMQCEQCGTCVLTLVTRGKGRMGRLDCACGPLGVKFADRLRASVARRRPGLCAQSGHRDPAVQTLHPHREVVEGCRSDNAAACPLPSRPRRPRARSLQMQSFCAGYAAMRRVLCQWQCSCSRSLATPCGYHTLRWKAIFPCWRQPPLG